MRHQTRGFSLIELLVVVVILGIIAGIAYPSYTNYVRQARRADGQGGIQQVANRLEKFFAYCNSYPTSPNALTDTWPANCPANPPAAIPNNVGLCPPGNVCNDRSPDGHYQITVTIGASGGSCSGAAANQQLCGFTIVANPNGAGVSNQQLNDGRLRMDSRGVKEWDKNNDGNYAGAGENKWK